MPTSPSSIQARLRLACVLTVLLFCIRYARGQAPTLQPAIQPPSAEQESASTAAYKPLGEGASIKVNFPSAPIQAIIPFYQELTGRKLILDSNLAGNPLRIISPHLLTREQAMQEASVWRSNLFGGGRAADFVARLRPMRTLGEYARGRGWSVCEGFIPGKSGSRPAAHIIGRPYLPSTALTAAGADESQISTVEDKPILWPRTEALFTAPMLLIREHTDLPSHLVRKGYLTYADQIVGFAAPKADLGQLAKVKTWLDSEIRPLRAYIAASSPKVQKATALMQADIEALPYPASGDLELSPNEQIVADDIIDYYRDFVRLGEKSAMSRICSDPDLARFAEVYARQVGSVYAGLRPLAAQRWPGALCQPFVFGAGEVDWSGADALRERLTRVLLERSGEALAIHRVARIFDGPFVFLLKPDRLRYWLRSAALRDADETLAELHGQGL